MKEIKDDQPEWVLMSKIEKPKDNKHHHAGCWNEGEMVGYSKCMVDVVIPMCKKILAARDAHIAGNLDEVYHQLYSIASPNFDKTEPWQDMENLVLLLSPK